MNAALGTIVVGLFSLYFTNPHKNMLKIKVYQKQYYVRKSDQQDMKITAKYLHNIHEKTEKLLHFLRNYKGKTKVTEINRLLSKYKGNLEELRYKYDNQTAYNINKGETIGLCIKKNGKYQDPNTIMFVTLHELAHCMTEKYEHNKEFWDNFKFLLKHAIKLGIYKYHDFTKEAKNYCGMNIDHSPYVM